MLGFVTKAASAAAARNPDGGGDGDGGCGGPRERRGRGYKTDVLAMVTMLRCHDANIQCQVEDWQDDRKENQVKA